MARKKRDAADSKNYVPQAAATEAEVLSMGFPNTGDADKDIETHMNRMANADETPPREREDQDPEDGEEETEEEDTEDEEVAIGGQRLRVRKDIAAVLRAQELQLNELRSNQRQFQPPEVKQEEEVDPLADAEKTIFSDPRGTLIKYGESLEKRITNRLTQQYNANRATDQYFSDFYKEHKDLATLDDTVKGVLRANLAEVSALNPAASRTRLAQLVRMQIDTIVKAVVPEDERREARRTTVEGPTRGGTSRQGNRREAPRVEAVKSLSSVIRDRKAARANGSGRTATR